MKFKPSGLFENYKFTDQNFSDYVTHMRAIISAAHQDDSGCEFEKAVDANSPKQFTSSPNCKVGVLLVHGLLSSPYSMQSLFDHFQAQQLHVRSLLLPGHGTIPADLLTIRNEQWLDCLRFAIRDFRRSVDRIILVGHSTGALLALLCELDQPSCDELILISPAIKIKSHFAFTTNWHHVISWGFERLKWAYIIPEADYARYLSIAFNGVHQVYLLTKQLQELSAQKKLSIPMLMVLSDDDEIIDSAAAENYFYSCATPNSQLIIYSNERDRSSDTRAQFFPSRNLAANILDYSHVCLAISPTHPHYGAGGDYHEFQHYHSWFGKPFKKNRHLPLFLGAISKKNLSNYHLQRITFNPQFDQLMHLIDQFTAPLVCEHFER